ncbi:hypothetical protein [Cohnella phaseoli]|uniref:hypothetical protein n=1 Tax=Cohnella phaseoli TaxID=456490 RepID=UPI0011C01EF8|nr:hypothetical protein [Cohnella phaseoli]
MKVLLANPVLTANPHPNDSLCDSSARIECAPFRHLIATLAKSGRIRPSWCGGFQSQSAANRVAKLEEDQVIEGYTVRLNYKKKGYAVHSFITILTRSFDFVSEV